MTKGFRRRKTFPKDLQQTLEKNNRLVLSELVM
jgi:hypothetical protein